MGSCAKSMRRRALGRRGGRFARVRQGPRPVRGRRCAGGV